MKRCAYAAVMLFWLLSAAVIGVCDAPSLNVTKPDILTPEERALVADNPDLLRVLISGRDVWGEEAMRQPGGPSYEFFAGLLPPLRYVNAEFRCYPIVLSAPGALHKSRLVSNGSAINAIANIPVRWHEVGFPVTFRAGTEVFGRDLGRLDGPHYARRCLPIVSMSYRTGGAVYSEEAFAPTNPALAERGAVAVRFRLKSGAVGIVSAEIGRTAVLSDGGVLRDSEGRALVQFSPNWRWNGATRELIASLGPNDSAVLMVLSEPAASDLPRLDYVRRRAECARTWEALIGRAMRVETPEAVVNDAWRSTIAGSFMLLRGDDICYSAGNQYEKIYVNEGSDAARSFLLWGYADEAKRMIVPLLEFERQGLFYHQAALKLQLLAKYYWLTRDARFVRDTRDRWRVQVERIINGREKESGLFPREQYCGDIERPVYSLNANANAWRGLRDWGAVLEDIGEHDQAQRLFQVAAEFRPVILKAVEKSVRRDFQPPFVPIALFGEEEPYDMVTATRTGGYYNLMAPMVLGSGVLGDDSEQTGWILDYLQQRGGLSMGMVRTHPGNVMYTVKQGTDDLYTLRYELCLLRRDDVDRALATFYGKLAQGFTRETFIDGETTGLVPLDKYGRPSYMPPNSTANGFFLWMLRYLLVQDWDIDDDGTPDTLRLMFATPRPWLADGKRVSISHALTAFGEVSVSLESRLSRGEVIAHVSAPAHAPKKTLLRARVPDGWRVTSAQSGERKLEVDDQGTADVTGLAGEFDVRFAVAR